MGFTNDNVTNPRRRRSSSKIPATSAAPTAGTASTMIVGFATNADQKAAETPWKGSFSIQRTGVVVHYVVSDDRKLAKPRRGGQRQKDESRHCVVSNDRKLAKPRRGGRQPKPSKHQTQQPKPPPGAESGKKHNDELGISRKAGALLHALTLY